MNQNLRHLLEHYRNLTGRGNMITANETMISIIQELADLYKPCQCTCATTTRDQSVTPDQNTDKTPLPTNVTGGIWRSRIEPSEGLEDPSMIEPEPSKPRRGRPPKLRSV